LDLLAVWGFHKIMSSMVSLCDEDSVHAYKDEEVAAMLSAHQGIEKEV
jgi:hypothetical protein